MEPTETEIEAKEEDTVEVTSKPKPKRRVTEKPEPAMLKVKSVATFTYKDKRYTLGETFEMSESELDQLKGHLARATARDGHAYIIVG